MVRCGAAGSREESRWRGPEVVRGSVEHTRLSVGRRGERNDNVPLSFIILPKRQAPRAVRCNRIPRSRQCRSTNNRGSRAPASLNRPKNAIAAG